MVAVYTEPPCVSTSLTSLVWTSWSESRGFNERYMIVQQSVVRCALQIFTMWFLFPTLYLSVPLIIQTVNGFIYNNVCAQMTLYVFIRINRNISTFLMQPRVCAGCWIKSLLLRYMRPVCCYDRLWNVDLFYLNIVIQ